MSSLTISPEGQIHFLLRFFARTLPVSNYAYDMTLATIPQYPAAGGWTVHGKTGSGWLRDSDGKINESRPQGWFVGWAEKNGQRVVFARLEVRTEKSDIAGGTKAREEMLNELPALIGEQ
jgi:beta-lactamase class D